MSTRTESANTLDTYQRKRNFAATPEPKGKRAGRSKALRFVIQKHAASHLHYDFRLELDGTLKSWAVPKGPSLDPKQKRLAMHVEDHPLAYADFEGVIPPGNYGAGTVIVWDNGEWEPLEDPTEGYRKGKLKFKLHGNKLHGIWNLVRSYGGNAKNKNAWFLIKHADDVARPAAAYNVVDELPDSVLGGDSGRTWQSNRTAHVPAATKNSVTKSREKNSPLKKTSARTRPQAALALPVGAKPAHLPLTIAPQLATLVDSIPPGKDWLYEMKLDGYRVLTRIDHETVRLFTRNGNDWSAKLPHLTTALQTLQVETAWLDGEIIALNEHDQPSFQQLQNAFENSRTAKIQYFLFDLLYVNGHDLRNVALGERRAVLQTLLQKPLPGVQFSQTFDVPTSQLLEHVCDLQLEGLIGKRAGSGYYSGRSRDWIKLKCMQRQEFVICGYTDPSGTRTGTFGSLLLGIHHPDSGELRYAGRVGTGFTDTTLRELMAKMKPLRRDKMPFAELTGERPSRAMHWLEPKLVGEVAFSEWTEGGHIRHPSFKGLRSDKAAAGITAEKPISSKTLRPAAPRKSSRTDSGKPTLNGGAGTAIEGIVISHAERIIDTKSGATKGDLAIFYQRIAPLLMPHLALRPVSLVRVPNGIDGQQFFQKHLTGTKISHLKELPTQFLPGHPPLVEIDSVQGLIACAQMNVIEFHTWNSTTADMAHPDRMIFDLDPGEGISWPQIQQAALLAQGFLNELKLKSFLKTSGGKGLHIVVPLRPIMDWDTVKNFSQAIVQHLATTLPALFVAKSGPKNRVKRIFADYLRNGYGSTTACAYSLRARPGLGVSVPIGWQDLDKLQGSGQWTVRDIDGIVAIAKQQPWKTYNKIQQTQTLDKAADILGVALQSRGVGKLKKQ